MLLYIHGGAQVCAVEVPDPDWTVGDVRDGAGLPVGTRLEYDGEVLEESVLLCDLGLDDGEAFTALPDKRTSAIAQCKARGLKRNMNALLGAVGQELEARVELLLETEEIDVNLGERVCVKRHVWGRDVVSYVDRGVEMRRVCTPETCCRPVLHVAVASGNVKITQMLLDAGADLGRAGGDAAMSSVVIPAKSPRYPSPITRITSPLHIAVRMYRGDLSMIKCLLAAGADPNMLDARGDTPLSLLCHPSALLRSGPGRLRDDAVIEALGVLVAAGGRLDWVHPVKKVSLLSSAVVAGRAAIVDHLLGFGRRLHINRKTIVVPSYCSRWSRSCLPQWAETVKALGRCGVRLEAGYRKRLGYFYVTSCGRRHFCNFAPKAEAEAEPEAEPDFSFLETKALNERGPGKKKVRPPRAPLLEARPRQIRRLGEYKPGPTPIVRFPASSGTTRAQVSFRDALVGA
eukprot:TRINITY_DN744_c0_g1_i13.p1 TRINITY_DN744_c0_g1~~TRINITY_DN744_c0_g1_i13.p1  ORF type:complete len:459 (+),score=81.80 TRINITY_DN744_c0_g1_i13:76-1452(+)